MNKKGIVDDIFLWTGLLFFVGLGMLITYIIFDGVNDGIQASDQLTQKGKDESQALFDKFPSVFDFTFLVVFVTAFVALLVLSWFLSSNPALFFAIVFVVVLIGVLAAGLSNAFIDSTTNGVLATASLSFPITTHILSNMVPYVVIMAFMMVIVFFAKPAGGGDV